MVLTTLRDVIYQYLQGPAIPQCLSYIGLARTRDGSYGVFV